MAQNPVVSVCTITYQHASYIEQCLDGILMQKTNFPFEIVCGDDYSTDGTREIIQKYAQAYADKMKLLLHPHNLGPSTSPGKNNFITTLKACRGKYIAFCEGDDYWTDPHKLQKQVDFLEAHPNFVMCLHPVEIRNDEGLNAAYPYDQAKKVSTIEDVIRGHFIPTLSLMFRNGTIHSFPQWFYKVMSGDIALELLLAQHGKIYCFQEKMGVYRQHSSSISKTLSHKLHGEKSRIYLFKKFNGYSDARYKEEIEERLHFLYRRYLNDINQHSKGLVNYYYRIKAFIDFNITLPLEDIDEFKARIKLFSPMSRKMFSFLKKLCNILIGVATLYCSLYV